MSEQVTFFELGKTHDDVALDIIRIFLGIALFTRGLLFVSDSSSIMDIVATGDADYLLPSLMMYAAILAHLMGGLMLAAGLLTRIGALIQIPVLVGAVFIALLQGGLIGPNQSLELSGLVLVLLIVFVVFGSGKYSINYLIFKPGNARSAVAHDHEQAGAFREKVATWAITRQKTEWERSESMESVVEEQEIVSAQSFHDANLVRLARVARYALIFTAAAVLLYFGLRSIPFEVSVSELGAIAGMLILILSFFFLFFGWALRGEGIPDEIADDLVKDMAIDTANDAANDTAEA